MTALCGRLVDKGDELMPPGLVIGDKAVKKQQRSDIARRLTAQFSQPSGANDADADAHAKGPRAGEQPAAVAVDGPWSEEEAREAAKERERARNVAVREAREATAQTFLDIKEAWYHPTASPATVEPALMASNRVGHWRMRGRARLQHGPLAVVGCLLLTACCKVQLRPVVPCCPTTAAPGADCT